MADSSANAHDVKTVGEIILHKMIGNTVSGYTFRKADQVKTLASKSVIQCGEDKVQVNPLLLFDRLAKMSSDLKSDMKHELTPHPSALF